MAPIPGSELLIVDGVDRDRAGMRAYFEMKGYVCTAVASGADALPLVEKKLFPAALIELDIDGPNGGIALIEAIRVRSRHTACVLTAGRPSFESAVAAIRAGAVDLVHKSEDAVLPLERAVERATIRFESTGPRTPIFEEVREVLDEAFKVMLGLSRRVYSDLGSNEEPIEPSVLIVDHDQAFLEELSWLVEDEPWEFNAEMNGGGALDRGMTTKIDIVASRDELMDLHGAMVVKSLQAQNPDVIGLVYSADGSGRVDRFERGELVSTAEGFEGSETVMEAVIALVEELQEQALERRYIKAFTRDHRAYVKRYAELKLKIDRLISE